MYLHIGSDINVKKEDVIGIFELDGKITPDITKEFLKFSQKKGIIESAGEDLPKSFIITENGKKEEKVYFSHIAVSSLLKRSEKSM